MADSHTESSLSFERVVFFSDAVFAIVITLLVLEIKPPHLTDHSESALHRALFELIPKITGFVISFLIVGMMWIEHHRIFRYIVHYDAGLLWRNLVLLLCVSFVPFPTALFSEMFWSRTALIFYTASFALVALAKLWVWHYAGSKPQLLTPDVDDHTVKRITRRSMAVPIACGLVIMLSFVSIWVAPMGFIAIPFIARLLDPTRNKKRINPRPETEEAA
jgi:uncharacterized membrane protein